MDPDWRKTVWVEYHDQIHTALWMHRGGNEQQVSLVMRVWNEKPERI